MMTILFVQRENQVKKNSVMMLQRSIGIGDCAVILRIIQRMFGINAGGEFLTGLLQKCIRNVRTK